MIAEPLVLTAVNVQEGSPAKATALGVSDARRAYGPS
jgi:hypothetical protein